MPAKKEKKTMKWTQGKSKIKRGELKRGKNLGIFQEETLGEERACERGSDLYEEQLVLFLPKFEERKESK